MTNGKNKDNTNEDPVNELRAAIDQADKVSALIVKLIAKRNAAELNGGTRPKEAAGGAA